MNLLIRIFIFSVLFLITLFPQGAQRYKDIVFSNYTLQSDIQFGSAQTYSGSTMTLTLDFYSPTGDTETKRPLVIFIHGGGFTSGDKVSSYGTLVCGGLAKRGYAVASINYRLGVPTDTDTSYFSALYRAIQDAKAAVRFFRRYASAYGIDTSQIFATGSSAGSKTALHMAYLDQNEVPSNYNVAPLGTLEGNSGNPGYSSLIHGVISCWGAMWDYRWIKPGDAPLYCVHGTSDATVPYDSSFSYHNLGIFKYGSQILYNWTQSLGTKSGLRLFYNTGHTLDNNSTKQDSALVDFSAWLYTILKINSHTNYYIDPVNGNDASAGTTQALAWKTLTKVNSVTFVPGDSVLFKCGGVWTGQIALNGSGSAPKPIVVGKYGNGAAPIINGAGTVQDAVYLYNEEYIIIRDLELTNSVTTPDNVLRHGVYVKATDYGTIHSIKLYNLNIHDVDGDINDKSAGGIEVEVTGSSVPTNFDTLIIDGCTILNCDRTGISTDSYWATRTLTTNTNWYPSTNVAIRNNWIERSGGNGLILRVAAAPVIEYNTFKQCGLTTSGNAVFPFNCDDALIQYNEAYLTVYNTGDADASGFDSDYRCKRSVFQYNYSHDNDGGFMVVTCMGGIDRFNDGTIVRYNISQNDHGDILYVSGQTSNTIFYNNTIYSGAGNTFSRVINHNSWNSAWPDSTSYHNNIFSIASGASYDFGSSTNTFFSNNIFYGSHPSSEPSDAAKLTSNPLFVSPGAGSTGRNTLNGYKLQSGSPAINSGILETNHAGFDFFGGVVPDGAVDRGAYEYQSAVHFNLTVNATNGTVQKNPNQTTFDSGATVILSPSANRHYHFLNWSGNVPSGQTYNNPLSLLMDGSKTVTANFVPDSFAVSTNATNGTITRNSGTGPYAYGSSPSFTANPASGYRFVNWSGDIPSGHETDNPLSLPIDTTKSITANFTIDVTQFVTVFTDTYDRADATPVSNGGTPTATYTTTNTGSGSASISTNMVKIVCAPSGSSGRSYVTAPLSTFSSPFNATLASNTDVITWTINLRTNRSTQPLSGFDATKFGIAFIITATNSNLLATGCDGYALAFGGNSARDYRLVRFINGLGASANLTTMISGASLGLTDGREYVSAKITYNPSDHTWKLYERNDGTGGPFGDPTTLSVSNLIGSIVDSTYTKTAGSVFGYLWNYSTSTNTNNAFFDNIKVVIGSSPVDYYYNGSGAINSTSSWGTNGNGTGTNPASFSATKQVFHLVNNTTINVGVNWTVSGSSSKIVLGDGSNPITVYINSGGMLNGSLEINPNVTVNVSNGSMPSIASNAGTVNIINSLGTTLSGNTTISTATGSLTLQQGNLTLNGYNLRVAGQLNCGVYKVIGSGTFTLDSGATLIIGDSAGITSSGASGAIQSVTRNFSAMANYSYVGNGFQQTGNGLPSTVTNLSMNLTNKNSILQLSSPVVVNSNLTLSRGKIKLGANDLSCTNVAASSDSGYIVTDSTGCLIQYAATTDTKVYPIGTESNYRKTTITFSTNPLPSHLSVRYVAHDPGAAGAYPSGIDAHSPEGYWKILSDGEPLQPYSIQLETKDMTGTSEFWNQRILKRADDFSAWNNAGTSVAQNGTLITESGCVGFSEFAYGGAAPAALTVTCIPEAHYLPDSGVLIKRDTFTVYIANSTAPYSIIDSCPLPIDSITFSGTVKFISLPSGNYYLVIKGNSCIETWSKSGGESILRGRTQSYDFTSGMQQAYGDNLHHIGAKWCLYTGDVNQDGIVDYSDLGLIDTDAYNYAMGYYPTDLNGDGFVDFTDLGLCDNSSYNYISVQKPGMAKSRNTVVKKHLDR